MKVQRGLEVYCTLSLISALDGVVGQCNPWVALPLGMTRYPFGVWMGGIHGWFWRVRNMSLPTGIRSPDGPACSESLYRL